MIYKFWGFFLLWIAFEFLENQLIFVGAHLWTIFCSNDQIVYFYTNTTVFWLLDPYNSVYNLYLYLYNNSWNQVALAFQLFEICDSHFHLNFGNCHFHQKKSGTLGCSQSVDQFGENWHPKNTACSNAWTWYIFPYVDCFGCILLFIV